PPERFMGASTNEAGSMALLGYPVDLPTGVADTREAWTLGIGWHYSAETYVDLPDWFEAYAAALTERSGVGR
ncbi:MAG: hypothetical protein NZ518_04060, partial [Dehalococcoidia bacterium]|nr:hypothetical protein [Dehalococcoidia bacterium]